LNIDSLSSPPGCFKVSFLCSIFQSKSKKKTCETSFLPQSRLPETFSDFWTCKRYEASAACVLPVEPATVLAPPNQGIHPPFASASPLFKVFRMSLASLFFDGSVARSPLSNTPCIRSGFSDQLVFWRTSWHWLSGQHLSSLDCCYDWQYTLIESRCSGQRLLSAMSKRAQ
jgi:hypothetical protein